MVAESDLAFHVLFARFLFKLEQHFVIHVDVVSCDFISQLRFAVAEKCWC